MENDRENQTTIPDTTDFTADPGCSYGTFICHVLMFHQTYFPLFSQILLCTVGAFSLVGNLTILITVGSKIRSLSNQFNHENAFVANFYFGSISLADLIATLVYLPSQVITLETAQFIKHTIIQVYVNISPQWKLGLPYCKIHILIGRMCDTFSVYTMMFMAWELYTRVL